MDTTWHVSPWENEITTSFDGKPGNLPTPFLFIMVCALAQEPFMQSVSPESSKFPICLEIVLSLS